MRESLDDQMDTAPPRGFRLRKRTDVLEAGDFIMTGNKAGDWKEVPEGSSLIGFTGERIATIASAEVKIAGAVTGGLP